MKKKNLFLSFLVFTLTSCSKTNLLYKEDAYNSPIFDENYYTEREDIDSLALATTRTAPIVFWDSQDGLGAINQGDHNREKRPWISSEKSEEFGYHNNLSGIEKSFNYGILSKLFDGRVRCEGYYQKSRVQLNKTGFAMYFPKSLVSANYIAFACRGGTTLNVPLGFGPYFNSESSNQALSMNFTLSFYIHISNSSEYEKVVYPLNNVNIQVDNHGSTNLVYFSLMPNELTGAVAMSLEWNSNDPRLEEYNLTDDYTNKEKDHLALMLYEVFIGESIWY